MLFVIGLRAEASTPRTAIWNTRLRTRRRTLTVNSRAAVAAPLPPSMSPTRGAFSGTGPNWKPLENRAYTWRVSRSFAVNRPATQATQTCPAASRRAKGCSGRQTRQRQSGSTSFARKLPKRQPSACKRGSNAKNTKTTKVLEEAYTQARKQVAERNKVDDRLLEQVFAHKGGDTAKWWSINRELEAQGKNGRRMSAKWT